ncbi:MAG: type IV secretory system conjugative DNA transfer family protein [Clostridia bacterium]|nr:type IV secretory system conjugative DNA transfer family protein [Clostridia bacterium]
MGRLYKKSHSESYRQYFAKAEAVAQVLTQYDRSKDTLTSPWMYQGFSYGGKGGVPISHDPETETVYLDHSDTHTLFFGATGSKKTRIGILPTVTMLGIAGESMVITDPKAEIYARTAGELAARGYSIKVLQFRSPLQGDGWNPFAIPYDFYCAGDVDRSFEFVSSIAHNLMISNQSGNKDPFWENSAVSLFYGLTIFMFKYCQEFGLSKEYVNVASVMRLRELMFSGNDNAIRHSAWWEYGKQDNFIYSALVGTVETASDTRGGILTTFDEKMTVFKLTPGLLQTLCRDEIRFDSIGQEKTALFIIMPDEKTTFHRLVSLAVKQSYEYLIYQVQEQDRHDSFSIWPLRCRINYVLDEFSSLPPIKDFPSMITAARSRNIRFFLVAQSKKQMMQRYGDETEAIQANCGNWFFFTSRELPLLRELSELCGTTRDGKPVVEAAELQHLDKGEGEVLILSGRNLPYVTLLPDIDYYRKIFTVHPFQDHETIDVLVLDYDQCQRQHAEQQADSLIKDILTGKHPWHTTKSGNTDIPPTQQDLLPNE